VIVERAQEAREEDHQQKRRERDFFLQQCRKRLQKMFHELDTDGNGALAKEELQSGIESNDEFADIMHVLDFSTEDMNVVFSMMDTDKDGKIDTNEFIEQIFKMRNQDSQTLLLFIKHIVTELKLRSDKAEIEETEGSVEGVVCSLCRRQCRGHEAVKGPRQGMRIPNQQASGTGVSDSSDSQHHGPTYSPSTQSTFDELWHEWRQWEVTHEDSALVEMHERVQSFNRVLEAAKQAVDHDLADVDEAGQCKKAEVNPAMRRKVDEDNLSCNRTQYAAAFEPTYSAAFESTDTPVSSFSKYKGQLDNDGFYTNFPEHEDQAYFPIHGHCAKEKSGL